MSRKVSTKKGSRRARKSATATSLFVAPPIPDMREILPAPALAALPTLTPPVSEPKLSRRERRKINANAVGTLDELLGALEEKKVQITLSEDIIVDRSIVIDYDVAINFNGHNLISEQNQSDFRLLDIRRGEVTLTGEGKIFVFGTASVAIRVFGTISSGIPNYTTLTVDEHIHIFAPDGSGILISANLGAAYGLTVNFSGSIIARSGICLGQGVRGIDGNLPIINIKSGSTIIADDACAAAVEATGLGIWRIGAAKLYGLSGLWVKLGQLVLEHTHIFASGNSIVFDGLPGANIDFFAKDGIYLSATDYVIAGDPQSLSDLSLEAGEYSGAFGFISPSLTKIASADNCNYSSNIRAAWADYAGNLPFPVTEGVLDLDAPEELTAPETSDTLIIPHLSRAAAKSSKKPGKIPKLPEIIETTTEIESPAVDPVAMPEVPEETSLLDARPAKNPPRIYAPFRPVPIPARPLEVIASPISLNISISPEPLASVPFAPVALPTLAAEPSVSSEPPLLAEPVSIPESPAEPDERAILIAAFSEAIASMRALKPSDYGDNFAEFSQILAETESILDDPSVSLDEISSAAAELLEAFDDLREDDDFSLSDAELDQLFYHGAVLKEVADAIDPEPVDLVSSAPKKITADNIADIAASVFIDDEDSAAEVAELDETTELANALDSFIDDETVDFIPTEVTEEEPERPFSEDLVAVSTAPAAPAANLAFIDEMSPSAQWSTGVATIDELTPVSYEGPAFRFHHRISTSISNFYRSLSAGFHAGLAAFHNSRSGLRV